MNPQTTRHFALTVHYGDPAITAKTVASVLANINPPEHIIVINHGRQPLSLKTDQRLIIINPKQNTGYAAGLNMGLGVISTLNATPRDVVTCFNNDVLFPPDTFVKLRQWWKKHPGDSLLGLAVKQTDQPPVVAGQVNLFTGRCRLVGAGHSRPPYYILPYVHGACFSASLHLMLSAHGLPTEYFMYWEDVLFSRQLARRRVPLMAAPDLAVIHHPSTPSSSAGDRKLYYLVRNGALFMERATPWPWRHWWWLANRLRYCYHSWRRRQPVVIRALKDAINHTTGPANF